MSFDFLFSTSAFYAINWLWYFCIALFKFRLFFLLNLFFSFRSNIGCFLGSPKDTFFDVVLFFGFFFFIFFDFNILHFVSFHHFWNNFSFWTDFCYSNFLLLFLLKLLEDLGTCRKMFNWFPCGLFSWISHPFHQILLFAYITMKLPSSFTLFFRIDSMTYISFMTKCFKY